MRMAVGTTTIANNLSRLMPELKYFIFSVDVTLSTTEIYLSILFFINDFWYIMAWLDIIYHLEFCYKQMIGPSRSCKDLVADNIRNDGVLINVLLHWY